MGKKTSKVAPKNVPVEALWWLKKSAREKRSWEEGLREGRQQGKLEADETAQRRYDARRVYFVGAHSSGKTTLAKWVSREYSIPLIPEQARIILGEWGKSLPEIRRDPALANSFQREIFNRQLEAERGLACFVACRACDQVAYAAEYSSVAGELKRDPRFFMYMVSLRTARVFLVRPQRELIKADGVREALDWDALVRIDAMTKFLLKEYEVPFVELGSAEMDSRVSTVRAVLGAAVTSEVASNN